MSQKKYIIYTLIKKLDSSEKIRFKNFLIFYFRNSKPYLELLNMINKINEKLTKEDEFPEDKLVAKLKDSKNFTKLKYNFKNALFSFLKFSYLESPENIHNQSHDLKDFFEYLILVQYHEYEIGYETLEKLAETLEKNNRNFDLYNTVLSELIEVLIPIQGWQNSGKKYAQLNTRFNKNIINHTDYINSKYLKRTLLLKKMHNELDGIENIFVEINKQKKNTPYILAEIGYLTGLTHYYSIKKEIDKEIEIREKILKLSKKIENKTDFAIGPILANIHDLILIKKEQIVKEEYYLRLTDYKNWKKELTLDMHHRQTEMIFLRLKLDYFLLFEDDAESINTLIRESKNLKFDTLQSHQWFSFQTLLISCMFKGNQMEEAHTMSSENSIINEKLNLELILVRILSAYLLFEDPLISSEYRKIKRILTEQNKPYLNLLKILLSFKTNKLKAKSDLIIEVKDFENTFAKELKRTDKVLINHFIKQV